VGYSCQRIINQADKDDWTQAWVNTNIALLQMTLKGDVMKTVLMSKLHQNANPAAPWAWHLGAHQASTLAAARAPRWLRVEAGSLWVTQANANAGGPPPDDIWLEAGDSLKLPTGSAWVVEAQAPADVSLVLPSPAAAAGVKRGWRGFSWARRGAAQVEA
jgi:Protein of unknown function (DUF2917)